MRSVKDYAGVNLSDKPETDKSIFIWLDIVGFSDAVDNEERYGELSELLTKFQSLFNECNDYNTNIISDGIILQISTSMYPKFVSILNDIGDKQLEFICNNKYFIRGGIALGTKLNNDKNGTFISNGLARAVKVEEKYVSWPIIGTEKKNIAELRTFFNTNNEEETFGLLQGFNLRGEAIYFIDFLKESKKYYIILNDKIKEYEKSPSIQSKYIWLLRYYHHKYNANNLDESLAEIIL